MARAPGKRALEQDITKARINAKTFNYDLATREGAIRQLEDMGVWITADQLTDWELGERDIPPDILYSLAKLYKAPELVHNYCAKCPIGKHIHPVVEVKTIESITLKTLMALDADRLQGDLTDLMKIAEDGVIDDTEKERFLQVCNTIDNIIEALQPFKVLRLKIEIGG